MMPAITPLEPLPRNKRNPHPTETPMKTHLTLKSSNEKTGPIPVSTSSQKQCPSSCPFRGNGCYAESGPLAIHFAKVTSGERGDEWPEFLAKIATLPQGQLWRHNQAGDLPGWGSRIAGGMLAELVEANKGKRGFTYTHKPMMGAGETAANNRQAVKSANAGGFVVNLSANNLEEADSLASLSIGPVVVVVPHDQTTNTNTPSGRKVVICPATQREGVSCATCQLCARGNRSVIIGFPAHGSQKKKASAVASN
jgi:hypothetical protein